MASREFIFSNLDLIWERITAACKRANRDPREVDIVAATKKQTVEAMRIYAEYCRAHGKSVIFGESYVQEYLNKRALLDKDFSGHLIGTLQSNKAREAVRVFDVIESVHSEKIAISLQKEAEKLKKFQDIFIQINVSADEKKAGFSFEEGKRFVNEQLPRLTNLRLKGLMTITREYERPEMAADDYAGLRGFRDNLMPARGSKEGLLLSMGMSGDYEIAVENGADIVRIGTAIFGSRS